MSSSSCDVLIVGGGLVGASLAAALRGSGLSVLVVEAFPLRAAGQPSFDERSTAIAWGSAKVFQRLGLWSAMAGEASPIHRVHVSEVGGFGVTRIDRAQQGVPALGFVVPNRAMGAAFAEMFERSSGDAELLAPAELVGLSQDDGAVQATVRCGDAEQRIRARVLVAADGAASRARSLLGVGHREHDYGQTALISNVAPGRPHRNVAYERFTPAGPVALLPFGERRCNLIYTVRHADAEAALALPDQAFLESLQARFGWRLGRFSEVGPRSAYPLKLVLSDADHEGRVVMIGNAAHSLHPVAGQGFNLGLRDALALAELLTDAARAQSDPGAPELLARYAAWRRRDQRNVSLFTDALARVFSTTAPGTSLLRSLGLLAVDLLPPLKRGLAAATMGRAGGLPRIMRGTP